MKKILATLFAALVLPAFAVQVGDKVSNSVPIESRNGTLLYSLPLPPGVWEVKNSRIRSSGGSRSMDMRDLALMLIEGSTLKQALEVTALAESVDGRWSDEPCKVEPTYYKNDYGTSLWRQKCLTVQPVPFLQNNNAPTRAAIDDLVRKGVSYENIGVKFTYTRYGDNQKFVIYRLFTFPSAYGLEKSLGGSINDSPWYPARTETDPIRSAFVKAVTSYAQTVVTSVDAAIEDKSIPPIGKFVYPPIQPVSTSGVPAPSTQESRLVEAKDLFNKGLITQDEYTQLKNKILTGADK